MYLKPYLYETVRKITTLVNDKNYKIKSIDEDFLQLTNEDGAILNIKFDNQIDHAHLLEYFIKKMGGDNNPV